MRSGSPHGVSLEIDTLDVFRNDFEGTVTTLTVHLKLSIDYHVDGLAGIFEGDYVIVVPQSEAKNGDIVVALIDDEATVKTFENRNGEIRLLPENDNYQPIEIKNTANFSLAGKVKGIIRYFN